MPALESLVETYLTGIEPLRHAVAGMTRDQLTARPVPNRWSTLEVVCHLADFEPIFVERMKRVLSLSETPLLLAADENQFFAALRYHDRDVAEELAVVDATRKQM